jgi:hypothetical protein
MVARSLCPGLSPGSRHDAERPVRRLRWIGYFGSGRYLELAQRRGLKLATLDKQLRDAAAALHISLPGLEG